jgi:hypothetical protein
MKILKIARDVNAGMEIGQDIKKTTNRDDMRIVRCILGRDESNITGILKFLGIYPDKINRAIKVGIWIELNK